ncbi:hypothetical protein D9M71_475490 [compost metagenome]
MQQVADGVFEVVDLVGRLGGVDHLEEAHGVDLHRGVVGGDDFLWRNIQHAFHHIHLAADAVHDRNDDVQPRLERVGVATETLDGPFKALGHDLETHEQNGDHQADKKQKHTTDLHNDSLLMCGSVELQWLKCSCADAGSVQPGSVLLALGSHAQNLLDSRQPGGDLLRS